VIQFRNGLNQIAKFFEVEMLGERPGEPRPGKEFRSLARGVLQDHRDWLREHEMTQISSGQPVRKPVGAEVVLPQLAPLLQGLIVQRSELVCRFAECAPIGWASPPQDRNPIALLWRCVESLAQAPRQGSDGQFPLFRFIWSLAELLDGPAGGALRAWVDDARVQLGLERAEPDQCLPRQLHGALTSEPSVRPCHLLVQVSPRLCEVDRYSVRAWLFGTNEPACLLAGEEVVESDELTACIDELRTELYRRQIEPEAAWIEFLLPRQLLCADVDQWSVELDFIESIPIGVEHRVVVRSLERASRPRAALALQYRSRALRRRLQSVCRLVDEPTGDEGDAVWIERDDCGGKVLYTTLKDAQGVVGAVLGQAPRPAPSDPAGDVLNTLFAAGLPVVLWMRPERACALPAARAEFARLLGDAPLARLPDRVWELRRQAVRSLDPDHWGRHLTLLWDDPAHRSPDFEEAHRLRIPSTEG
jgi:hypothetical protein